MSILSEKGRSGFVEWIAVFICFYYPITAVVIHTLRVPSTPINIGIKSGFAVASMTSILLALLVSKPKINIGVLPAIGFWIIYSIRLVYDINVREIMMETKSTFFIYSMAYGANFLPILALTTNKKNLKFSSFSKKSFQVILVANFCILYYVVSSPDSIQDLLLTRLNLSSDTEQSTLNPITISLFGELLALLSLNYVINKKSKLLEKLFYASTAIIGITHLVLGASRSPLIGFVLCLSIIIYINYISTKKSVTYYLSFISVLLVLGTGFYYGYQSVSESTELAAASRVTNFVKDGSGGDNNDGEDPRFAIYEGAWNDFLDSPIIGKQYVTTHENFYPHNIILEVLMATGIIGFTIFFIFVIFSVISLKKIINNNNKQSLAFLLILFPTVIGGMTSGAIFQSPELWIMGVFMIVAE